MDPIRLQKFLAQANIASRRASEQLILEGKVFVNGIPITSLGSKIDPERDIVTINGEVLAHSSKRIYIMLNKPKGYVSTVKDDRGRKTVLDLLPGIKERIYPVGRLDYDTRGLLILTNDGAFTYSMTHPKHAIKKTYLVKIAGIPDDKDLSSLRNGIELSDGLTAPAEVKIVKKANDTALLRLTIQEGRNRQVRRMMEAIDHRVLDLKRIQIGNLQLRELKAGAYRYLEQKEIKGLLALTKAETSPKLDY